MALPFDFSKRSRRALYQYVILLILVALLPRAVFMLISKPELQFSQSEFQRQQLTNHSWKMKRNYRHYEREQKTFKVPPRRFDPNQYAASDWMQLGLSAKQAAIVVKFGKRGFYTEADLKRVFVISDDFYARIKDSLIFPVKPTKVSFEKSKPKEIALLELNLATEEELQNLPGIGAYFAQKIVERRSRLGGFIHTDQLLEVWKMDSTKVNKLKPYLHVDPNLLRPISLNSISADELRKHPYFNWNIANSIVKLREQHGNFQSIQDIRKSKLIDAELFEKIKPYLSL